MTIWLTLDDLLDSNLPCEYFGALHILLDIHRRDQATSHADMAASMPPAYFLHEEPDEQHLAWIDRWQSGSDAETWLINELTATTSANTKDYGDDHPVRHVVVARDELPDFEFGDDDDDDTDPLFEEIPY